MPLISQLLLCLQKLWVSSPSKVRGMDQVKTQQTHLTFEKNNLSLSYQMMLPSYIRYQVCCLPNSGEKHQFSFSCVSYSIPIAALFIFRYYDKKEFSNDRTKVSLWQLLQRDGKSPEQGELHHCEWP